MKKILIPFIFVSFFITSYSQEIYKVNSTITPKSDVFMQGFYWNSPPGGIWWDSLSNLAPRLSSAGFSAIWVPSAVKGANGPYSMGYDPYDHYDFGEYYQKGTLETRFGSRTELEQMIDAYHTVGIQVFADAVLNHMNGGEQIQYYECSPPGHPDSAWLQFYYPTGSGRFKKDSTYFYPNSVTCDVNPPYHGPDNPAYRFGEWLAHNRDFVRDSLVTWGLYLREVLGFDGFRLDAVKSIEPSFMGYWLQNVNTDGAYAVAEYWGSTSEIGSWLNECQNVYGGNVSMFDFPLRYTLRDMCNNTDGTWDMNNLDGAGLVNNGISGFDVATFVENHDVDRIGWDGETDSGHDPIYTNKDMAYAYIIFSEGRPSVFFKDYFTYGLAGKIDTLIWIRQNFIWGGTTKRSGLNPWYLGSGSQSDLSKHLYVARRDGGNGRPAVYIVINNHPTEWRGVWVNTDYPNQTFRDYTYQAMDKTAAGDGRVDFWAPPRGYAIYVPDLTKTINNPPSILNIPDLTIYSNQQFQYQVIASDANGDSLVYSLDNNPTWLNINTTGLINGTPSNSDVGNTEVYLIVDDLKGGVARDTFQVSVELNLPPIFANVNDTTIEATKRFEYQLVATDPENDALVFNFLSSNYWLNLDEETGFLAGTPSIDDTAEYYLSIQVSDNKGGFDTTSFNITVVAPEDSNIQTFGKPKIDGKIEYTAEDWKSGWILCYDDSTDSYWNSGDTTDNEIFRILATWDADTLYLGFDYIINDNYNSLIAYLDVGKTNGTKDFNSNRGYSGEYARNFVFRDTNNIDFMIADYYHNPPVFYSTPNKTSINNSSKFRGIRGQNGEDLEVAIPWNSLYGLGAGRIDPNAKVKIVTVVAGGLNWGAGDSAPDNNDVDGNAGPDSLNILSFIFPDRDGDGYPDPTIFMPQKIKLSTNLIDFGTVYTDPILDTSAIFEITNVGGSNLIVDSLSTLVEPFSVSNLGGKTLPMTLIPNERVPITIKLERNITPGNYIASLIIYNNDETKVITIKGTISNKVNIGEDSKIPKEYSLSQNYPNPFNPSTVIVYQLPVTSRVEIQIFNVLGQQVATLINEEQSPGNYEVEFNAKNLSSGMYFYKIQAGNFSDVKKMMVLK